MIHHTVRRLRGTWEPHPGHLEETGALTGDAQTPHARASEGAQAPARHPLPMDAPPLLLFVSRLSMVPKTAMLPRLRSPDRPVYHESERLLRRSMRDRRYTVKLLRDRTDSLGFPHDLERLQYAMPIYRGALPAVIHDIGAEIGIDCSARAGRWRARTAADTRHIMVGLEPVTLSFLAQPPRGRNRLVLMLCLSTRVRGEASQQRILCHGQSPMLTCR